MARSQQVLFRKMTAIEPPMKLQLLNKEVRFMAKMQVLGEFYFSRLLGTPIYDATGKKIGKIRDMAIRWQSSYPRIVGMR